jgi:hypothetical protein
MRYDYGEIIDFNSSSMIDALSFFYAQESSAVSYMQSIEEKHSRLQESFDIMHPNITVLISGYLFNKETWTIESNTSLVLYPEGSSVEATEVHPSEVGEKNRVVHVENIGVSTEYLGTFFLDRDVKMHNVAWMYSLPSSILVQEWEDFDENIFPSYDIVDNSFYKKRFETFSDIFSIGSLSSQDNAMTKGIGVRFFNPVESSLVVCMTKRIIADSFSYIDYVLKSVNVSTYRCRRISFESSFQYKLLSPISYAYSESTYAYNTLSNVSEFNVRVAAFSDRADKEVISASNILERMDLLYDKTTTLLFDSFKVEVSKENDAATFKSIMHSLIDFLNSFYVDQLRLFLSNYIDFGPLSDMISYIEARIKELNDKYVKNTECDIPLNNIDEGCNIPCDNIHLEEPHLMVTKQKLKAIVKCSLVCDTMPFTADELQPVTDVPILESQDIVNIETPA